MVSAEDIIKEFKERETWLIREEYRPMWTAEQIEDVIRSMIARDEKGRDDDG